MGGAWAAQSVELRSRFRGSCVHPHIGLAAVSAEPASDSLSLSLCTSPAQTLSLSQKSHTHTHTRWKGAEHLLKRGKAFLFAPLPVVFQMPALSLSVKSSLE